MRQRFGGQFIAVPAFYLSFQKLFTADLYFCPILNNSRHFHRTGARFIAVHNPLGAGHNETDAVAFQQSFPAFSEIVSAKTSVIPAFIISIAAALPTTLVGGGKARNIGAAPYKFRKRATPRLSLVITLPFWQGQLSVCLVPLLLFQYLPF